MISLTCMPSQMKSLHASGYAIVPERSASRDRREDYERSGGWRWEAVRWKVVNTREGAEVSKMGGLEMASADFDLRCE